MRLIHTADWHLGATLRGHDRAWELGQVLDALVGIVRDKEADAIVVAGDVFDSQNPSGEAQRLLYDTLAALHRARPGLTVIMTAGNHDAAGRLEAPQALLSAFGVRAVGNVRRTGGRIDVERHLVMLSKGKRAEALVLAVSHPTAACLPPWTRTADGTGSPVVAATRALYGELVAGARPHLGKAALIVTGHLHVSGGEESEGAERRILVGGEHAVPPDIFPDDAAYVALGHLHKPQRIGRETIRYSGSLIPLSATELGYGHGVTLVTIERGKTAVEHIPLPRPVPFLRLPETGEATAADLADRIEALGLPADLPVERRPFLRVHLAREGLDPGFRAEVDRLGERLPVRIVDIRLTPRAGQTEGAPVDAPGVRLADRAPDELFRAAFRRTHGVDPQAAHLDAFHATSAEA